MKFNWTQETTSRVFSNALALVIALAFLFLLQNMGDIFGFFKKFFSILSPFVTGFIIAYLLSRPVAFLEKFFNKHLFKKAKKQHSINKALSIAIVFLLALVILSLVIYSIIPQLIDSVTTLAKNADGYIKTVTDFINALAARFHFNADILKGFIGSSQELFKKLVTYISSSLPAVVNFSVSIGSGISNFIIGLIISIYMLSGKERFCAQTKKLLAALFPKKFVDGISSIAKYTHETFGNYLTGQILDCLILGAICFILMTILGMDYALLISMIVTLTNFIPFVGPFIGAIPSAFILLMVQPQRVIWFIVMILLLQQLDGNILVPKIVGKTTGLSSFWVIFAILVGGGLFGVGGVLLAVPTFSVIHLLFKKFLERQLKKKNLPVETSEYYK